MVWEQIHEISTNLEQSHELNALKLFVGEFFTLVQVNYAGGRNERLWGSGKKKCSINLSCCVLSNVVVRGPCGAFVW